MSAYTLKRDNSFFDEKSIICPQELNRIFSVEIDDPVEIFLPVNFMFLGCSMVTVRSEILLYINKPHRLGALFIRHNPKSYKNDSEGKKDK